MVRWESGYGSGKFRARWNGSDELLPAILGAADAPVERSLSRGQFRLRKPDRQSGRICRALYGGVLDGSNGHLRGGRVVAGFNCGFVGIGLDASARSVKRGQYTLTPNVWCQSILSPAD